MTNPVSNHDMKVFTGVSNPDLSKRLARYCGVTVSDADFCLHNNGDYQLSHSSIQISFTVLQLANYKEFSGLQCSTLAQQSCVVD